MVNGASFVAPWRSADTQNADMVYDSRRKQESFSCPEPLCISQFANEQDMNTHLASNSHRYPTVRTGIDQTLLYYARQKSIQFGATEVAAATSNDYDMDIDDEDDNHTFGQTYGRGWARKLRKVNKITTKQKDFIEKLFKSGAATKTKLSAEQMAELMHNEMVDGVYYFLPQEYLEPKRIRNLICRLDNQVIKNRTTPVYGDDNFESYIDDVCDSVIGDDNDIDNE